MSGPSPALDPAALVGHIADVNESKHVGPLTPPGISVPALDRAIDKVLGPKLRRMKQQETPEPNATRLKLVWRLWHLLPNNWSAEIRIRLLLTPVSEIPRLRKWHSDKGRPFRVRENFWREFTGQFSARDAGTFEAARWWNWFLRECCKVVDRFDHVKEQVEFKDFLLHDSEDVATYRTLRELQIAYPKFWEISAPELGLIERARRRWEAYEAARSKAEAELRKLVYPKSGFQRPFAQRHEQQERLARWADPKKLATHLSGDFWNASLFERERFIQEDLHPEPLLEKGYVMVAANIACGTIAPAVLRNFMAKDFLALSEREQIRFVRLCDQLRGDTKKNRYRILKAWLSDNAPVFQEFCWRLDAVIKAMADRFTDYPGHNAEDEEGVFKSALNDWGIVLGLPTGRKRVGHYFKEPHNELLTEPPKLHLLCPPSSK